MLLGQMQDPAVLPIERNLLISPNFLHTSLSLIVSTWVTVLSIHFCIWMHLLPSGLRIVFSFSPEISTVPSILQAAHAHSFLGQLLLSLKILPNFTALTMSFIQREVLLAPYTSPLEEFFSCIYHSYNFMLVWESLIYLSLQSKKSFARTEVFSLLIQLFSFST